MQKKTGQLSLARLHFRLEASDVRSLQTFRSAGDLEFNRLPFVERLVPFRLDSGEVYENVFTGLALDEPETLTGVEPLYSTLFFHLYIPSFNLSYLCFSTASSRKAKALSSCWTRKPPFDESKGVTGATNAGLP